MLVSATTRGTLPAAAKLLDSASHAGVGHPGLTGSAGAIALEPSPAPFRRVASQCLADDFGLGTAFLFGQTLGRTDYVRGKQQRSDSRRRHFAFLD